MSNLLIEAVHYHIRIWSISSIEIHAHQIQNHVLLMSKGIISCGSERKTNMQYLFEEYHGKYDVLRRAMDFPYFSIITLNSASPKSSNCSTLVTCAMSTTFFQASLKYTVSPAIILFQGFLLVLYHLDSTVFSQDFIFSRSFHLGFRIAIWCMRKWLWNF